MKKDNVVLIAMLLATVMLTIAGSSIKLQLGKNQEDSTEVANWLKTDTVDETDKDDNVTVVTKEMKESLFDKKTEETDAVQYDDAALMTAVDRNKETLYYYEALNDEEQKLYKELYLSVMNHEEVVVSTLDTELLDKIYQCVMLDHPEIFYSNGYSCIKYSSNNVLDKITFEAKYNMNEEEITERQNAIDAYTENCLSAIPDGLDQYGQIKFIYDYIIENTRYDLNAEDNQNICSVFLNGASVCQGYAEATQYLLRKLGFEITTVTGTAEGGSHAWNLVRADGDYYYLDTTWGDVDYKTTAEGENDNSIPVNYDYFMITTSQLEKTHTIESIVTMPACVATKDNYYVRKGTFFSVMDEAKISECFAAASAAGESTLTLKAENDVVFQELKDYLLEEQRIFEYINETDSVSYFEDPRMNTICFWLKR